MREARILPGQVSRDEDVPVAVVVDRLRQADEDAQGEAHREADEDGPVADGQTTTHGVEDTCEAPRFAWRP